MMATAVTAAVSPTPSAATFAEVSAAEAAIYLRSLGHLKSASAAKEMRASGLLRLAETA